MKILEIYQQQFTMYGMSFEKNEKNYKSQFTNLFTQSSKDSKLKMAV
jgi:hypothetical protein